MSDRELLELAAKAAGYASWDWHPCDCLNVYTESGRHSHFNPLTDDGDALRLAVKLKIPVNTEASYFGAPDDNCNCSRHRTEPYAATRRAIVRAAAEIGRSMP